MGKFGQANVVMSNTRGRYSKSVFTKQWYPALRRNWSTRDTTDSPVGWVHNRQCPVMGVQEEFLEDGATAPWDGRVSGSLCISFLDQIRDGPAFGEK